METVWGSWNFALIPINLVTNHVHRRDSSEFWAFLWRG